MEPLEVVLKKTESMIRDTSAEIVIQESEGYFGFIRRGVDYPEEERWVETKKIITKPDTTKREFARKELQLICDTTEWFSVKHRVAHTVGHYENGYFISAFPFDENVSQIDAMRQRMNDPQRDTAYKLDVLKDAVSLRRRIAGAQGGPNLYEFRGKLDELLDDCCFHPDKEVRKQACQDSYFHFPRVEIWAGKHPVVAALTGFAAIGAAYGLYYALAEHFGK